MSDKSEALRFQEDSATADELAALRADNARLRERAEVAEAERDKWRGLLDKSEELRNTIATDLRCLRGDADDEELLTPSAQKVRQRIAEATEKLKKVETAVRKHHDQHADDLCWMDDNELYAAIGLPPRDATTGDQEAMLKNCQRYIRQRCTGAGDWPSYADLESRLAEATAESSRRYDALLALYDAFEPPIVASPADRDKAMELAQGVLFTTKGATDGK